MEVHEHIADRGAAAAPRRPGPSTDTVRGLQRAAGNQAVARWLTASPVPLVAREPAAATASVDKAAMQALEQRMQAVKQDASGRSTALNRMSDVCIQLVRDAKDHLKESNANYKVAHKQFMAVLERADARHELEEAVVDSVQGILIAAALAVVGPETLVLGAAIKGLENAAARQTSLLAEAGFTVAGKTLEGGAGEVAEQVVGAGVNATKDGSGKPSESAAAAGDTPGDRYEEAFGTLDTLIGALPKLGLPATAAKDCAIAAGDVTTEAVRLAGGTTGRWTAAEAEAKGAKIGEVNQSAAGDLAEAQEAKAKVEGIAMSVMRTKIEEPETIERMLWTNWMASLRGGKQDLLDNDKISDYLEAKGMVKFGDWTSSSDEAEAVNQARKDVLRQKGIELPPGAQIDSLYKREMKHDELTRTLVGRRGRITARDKVAVGDGTYDAPGMMGGQIGSEVVISLVNVKPYRSDPTINIDVWDARDFDVLGNTVTTPE